MKATLAAIVMLTATFLPITIQTSRSEPTASATNHKVLWDLTHGVLLNYQPSGSHSGLVSMLQRKGYSVSTTTAGVGNISLADYSAIVISIDSSWDSAYAPAEVAVIRDFVNAGGGLLILGDNPGCRNYNVNPVARAFGFTCGVSYLRPSGLYLSTFSVHPIFAGCSKLFFCLGGEVTAVSPGELVGWTSTGVGSIGASRSGAGRVVVVGDVNIFAESEWLNRVDNRRFAANVFDWLMVVPEPGCAVVLLAGIGTMAGLMRKHMHSL